MVRPASSAAAPRPARRLVAGLALGLSLGLIGWVVGGGGAAPRTVAAGPVVVGG